MTTKIIGNKIAEARKRLNISQAQLAERLYITAQAVGKWERGESMPDITTFDRLAEILGVDLNYFSENATSSTDEMPPIDLILEHLDALPDPPPSRSSDRQAVNFSGSNLPESDFAGVTARKGKFVASAFRGSDFSGADLTGSSFKASDLREGNFDRANLTDCNFYALDLTGASFQQSILVRTNFSASGLKGATFTDVKLTNVTLTATDLTKTFFERCTFDGVDFDKSDLRGVCFDGQSFTNVKFDNSSLNEASFKGATLKNVSFRASFAITNRFYRGLKTICFDGASMDKLTYAALKGLGVDLSKVTVF
ncbi:MAG TPA: pentapeptide repeat-containing protein [Candidatus Kapabacteria bacterium]|nr:pentapeptide repeat-containing protein [Candidatus Kapabacteria bacterium]